MGTRARREFLRRTGLGSVALGSAALAFPLSAGSARADDGRGKGTNYHFLVVSAVANAPDRLVITGDGTFDASRATGGGSFDHFRAGGSPPLPLVASGTWQAGQVLSFAPLGTHGVLEGGVLRLLATFRPRGAAAIRNVTLEVACNLGPAGASTGKPEGVTVTVPGPTPLVFAPQDPTVGVTVFTTAREPGQAD